MARPVNTAPPASYVVAAACVLCPAVSDDAFSATATVATGTVGAGSTVSVADAVAPSLLAAISVEPVESAVICAAATVATAGLLDVHTTSPATTGLPASSFITAVAVAVCPTTRVDDGNTMSIERRRMLLGSEDEQASAAMTRAATDAAARRKRIISYLWRDRNGVIVYRVTSRGGIPCTGHHTTDQPRITLSRVWSQRGRAAGRLRLGLRARCPRRRASSSRHGSRAVSMTIPVSTGNLRSPAIRGLVH